MAWAAIALGAALSLVLNRMMVRQFGLTFALQSRRFTMARSAEGRKRLLGGVSTTFFTSNATLYRHRYHCREQQRHPRRREVQPRAPASRHGPKRDHDQDHAQSEHSDDDHKVLVLRPRNS